MDRSATNTHVHGTRERELGLLLFFVDIFNLKLQVIENIKSKLFGLLSRLAHLSVRADRIM